MARRSSRTGSGTASAGRVTRPSGKRDAAKAADVPPSASYGKVRTNVRRAMAPVTVERLLRLYEACRALRAAGRQYALSHEIAGPLGCSASQVRGDLSRFGEIGTRGYGYRVDALIDILERFLGKRDPRGVVLVGTGGAGAALLERGAPNASRGYRFVAAFDGDPARVGVSHRGIEVRNVAEIAKTLETTRAEVAVLDVPPREAQTTAAILAGAGVRAILNLTGVPLALPPGVLVGETDLAVELEKLTCSLGRAVETGVAADHSRVGTERKEAAMEERKAPMVLVAEDEPDQLRALERILTREGYGVDGASDGAEAAKKLLAGRYDVVVSDLRMPGADGMELLRAARERNRDVVFVIVTGYGTPDVATEAMRLGALDFITKPFSPATLCSSVRRGLETRRFDPRTGAPASPRPARRWGEGRDEVATATLSPAREVRRFPKDRAWVSPQPDGTCLVGADERFYERAGDVVFYDLPFEGAQVARGERCARTIDSTGLVQTPFRSPVSGTVIAVNENLLHDPQAGRRDPVGDGWLFKVSPSRLQEDLKPAAR